jgi:hypothetical protein
MAMDRADLLSRFPDPRTWDLLHPVRKKGAVITTLRDLMRAIAGDQREPDSWEASLICASIGATRVGWYSAALAYSAKALVEPEIRAPEWTLEEDMPTAAQIVEELTRTELAPTPIQL